jgi:aminoglycoside N3'-acetyltransferase
MADGHDHPFDPQETPCLGMGVVANIFWQLPGVMRSNCPHAFAARGSEAARITAPHPLDAPNSLESPVGRVYGLDGQVLLLGVGHEDNTTIHLAERLAGVRYRRKSHVCLLQAGQPTRVEYAEIDHCCQNFSLVDGWLDAQRLQRLGKVGHADARLVRSHHVVNVVTEYLRHNETAFLHPLGFDHECDEARASLRSLHS